MENNNLSTEFISEKSLKTFAQAALTVFSVTSVISSIAKASLSSDFYRNTGLVLSILMSIFIFFFLRKPKNIKSVKEWVFAFLNGLLIFTNVSGMNSIAARIQETNMQQPKVEIYLPKYESHAGLFSFLYIVDWWPDKQLIEENKNLKKQNQIQLETIDSLKKKLRVIDLTGSDTNITKSSDKIEQVKKSADSIGVLAHIYKKSLDSISIILKNQKNNSKSIDSLKKIINSQAKNPDFIKQNKETIDSLYKIIDEGKKILEKLKKENGDYEKLKDEYNNLNRDYKKIQNENEKCQERLKSSNEKGKNYDECKLELSRLKDKYGLLKMQLEKCEKSKDTTRQRSNGIK